MLLQHPNQAQHQLKHILRTISGNPRWYVDGNYMHELHLTWHLRCDKFFFYSVNIDESTQETCVHKERNNDPVGLHVYILKVNVS